jgi:hypothetical protein
MDKGTTGLKPIEGDEEQAASIEKEIEVIRNNLDGLVDELDQRRHRLSPAYVAKHHPAVLVLGGLVVVGAVWAGLAIHSYRERKRSSWMGRVHRLRSALGNLLENSDPIAAKPGTGKKILTAAATAAVAVAARRLAGQMFNPST